MGVLNDQQAVEFAGWPEGADNVSRENSITGKRVRLFENLDVDNKGKPSTRAGYSVAVAGNTHSVWSDEIYLYAVVAGVLTAYDVNMSPTAIQSGFGQFEYLSFASINGYAYWSSTGRNGRIDIALGDHPIGLPAPGTPALAVATSGGLDAGVYQVAVTAFDLDGNETGATSSAALTIAAGQGISVAFQGTPVGAQRLRVYITPANGDVLYAAWDFPAGDTTVVIGQGARGKMHDTSFLFPMPPGQLIFRHGSRLFCAAGPILWYSEPFKYGYTHHFNYLRFPAPVTVAASVGSGPDATIVVCSGDRTYVLEGTEPKEMTRRIVRHAGGVAGTGVLVPDAVFSEEEEGSVPNETPGFYWLGSDGVACVATPGNAVQAMTLNRAESNINADWGATLLRTGDSLTQLVTSVRGGSPNGLIATDSAVATVYKQSTL